MCTCIKSLHHVKFNMVEAVKRMAEDKILDNSLMQLSTVVDYKEAEDLSRLAAMHQFVIYWEHITLKKFFDNSIEMRQSGVYRQKGLVAHSCYLIDCKKIIFWRPNVHCNRN